MIGFGTSDDAGAVRLADGGLLVQSVDFFTPIVDDAYDWGRIAAANALSDLYAMGAVPFTALQLVAWPRDTLPFDLLGEVVRGGADVMAQAGCVIVGGHSIDDREPKYGFAVTGRADGVVSNAGALPGDRLVLTKPIGTGIVSTAVKAGRCPAGVEKRAVEVMAGLNAAAAQAMMEIGVHAATDVTGFGLLGHLREMLVASGVDAEVEASAVPVIEGAWELLDEGMYPSGSARNLEAVRPWVRGPEDDRSLRMLCDAQTSGGLLLAVPPDRTAALADLLERKGVVSSVIGRVTGGEGGYITIRP